jgi:hypothetical protein
MIYYIVYHLRAIFLEYLQCGWCSTDVIANACNNPKGFVPKNLFYFNIKKLGVYNVQ